MILDTTILCVRLAKPPMEQRSGIRTLPSKAIDPSSVGTDPPSPFEATENSSAVFLHVSLLFVCNIHTHLFKNAPRSERDATSRGSDPASLFDAKFIRPRVW